MARDVRAGPAGRVVSPGARDIAGALPADPPPVLGRDDVVCGVWSDLRRLRPKLAGVPHAVPALDRLGRKEPIHAEQRRCVGNSQKGVATVCTRPRTSPWTVLTTAPYPHNATALEPSRRGNGPGLCGPDGPDDTGCFR